MAQLRELRQISNQKFLQELQKRVQDNQITSGQLAQILKERVNQIVKNQEELQKQAIKDYEEWINRPWGVRSRQKRGMELGESIISEAIIKKWGEV